VTCSKAVKNPLQSRLKTLRVGNVAVLRLLEDPELKFATECGSITKFPEMLEN
jgi:hypothetical protein